MDAAIEGGADAVYLGGSAFNARMNAHNFGGDALRSAVLRAHAYGVKVYLTLNTLVTDREMRDFVQAAADAARAGVDALIVADLGGAAAIHRAIPSLELHASTQMSGHSLHMAEKLARYGFSRMVIARETPAADLETVVRKSPIEIEMFVHGALCVSHSGQCLFSSLVGGRSGNRGECAQPCRLPYCNAGRAVKKEAYPLSLKDLSLACHVPRLIDCGVTSLKIEGRMKSPEYVRDTARIWRRLLDERRAATPQEMQALADAFSRGGFTDGYYREQISHAMLGIRSDSDKNQSRALEPFAGLTRKIPLSLSATIRIGAPMLMSVSNGGRTVSVAGEIPQAAINAPLSRENAERNLSKLGGTPYAVDKLTVEMDERVMVPISALNALRRQAIAAWETEVSASEHKVHTVQAYAPLQPTAEALPLCSARFYRAEQITPTAREFFGRIYLPLGKETPLCDGVVLPPVIFERETPAVEEALRVAADKGIRYALVGNLAQLSLVRRAGMIPIGDFRLNVTNNETVCALEEIGICGAILSPELTLPQARDIGGDTSLIVYGRIPLMTLEKCVIKEVADCKACATGCVYIRDRKGVEFPVLREWEHRNVIYNSLPTCMSDRADALNRARIRSRHFLFSTETPDDVDRVIHAFRSGTPLPYPVRRIADGTPRAAKHS